MRSNYQKTRKTTLEKEGGDPELTKLSPEERVAMVWEITRQAEGSEHSDEPRLRRDVVRTLRGRR